VIGLLLLKHLYGLSDEDVCEPRPLAAVESEPQHLACGPTHIHHLSITPAANLFGG
jgi:hypothetical protein